MDLSAILEAIIFASEKPLSLKQLKELTREPRDEISAALETLQAHYAGRGMQLVELSGGFHFRTHPEAGEWVQKLMSGKPQRLTRPMLEALAIIAYQQPITRPEIEEIRGVDCGGTLRVLLERNLIRILGKKEEAGRPLIYGTSKFFLEFFSLSSLKELPSLREFTELSQEHQQQVEFYFGNRGDEGRPDLADGTPQSPLSARAQAATLTAMPEAGFEGPPAPAHLDGPARSTNAEPALEGPPLPPHLARDRDSADNGGQRSVVIHVVEGPVEEPLEGPPRPGPANPPKLRVVEPADVRSAPAPQEPDLTEEEDMALLEALDSAIERASAVLTEINPRKKPEPDDDLADSDGDSDSDGDARPPRKPTGRPPGDANPSDDEAVSG